MGLTLDMIRMPSPQKVAPLGDIAAEMFLGVNLTRLPKTEEKYRDTPIIHIKDISDGALADTGALEHIHLPDTTQNRRQRLTTNDLLVSARGTLMKCAWVTPLHEGAVASANFIIIRLPEQCQLHPALLWAHLRRPLVQDLIISRTSGTAQPILNVRELAELRIPIPSDDVKQDLTELVIAAHEQYRIAIECARLRRDESMDVLARYMDTSYAS